MAINAPAQWKLYLIPDLKTWSTDTPNQTPIERTIYEGSGKAIFLYANGDNGILPRGRFLR